MFDKSKFWISWGGSLSSHDGTGGWSLVILPKDMEGAVMALAGPLPTPSCSAPDSIPPVGASRGSGDFCPLVGTSLIAIFSEL
jgi:hypothetical protein